MDGLFRIVGKIVWFLFMITVGFLIGWLFRAAKEDGRVQS